MKIFYLFLFILTLSCGAPKKDATDKGTLKNEKTNKSYERELVLVLNDITRETKIKEYLKNSGIQWKKKVFDNGSSKIAVIQIPDEKYDFWLKALETSSEFKIVKRNSKNVVKNLIKREKNNLLTIRKTGCFGDCPSYDLNISKQGEVIFNGKQYVLAEGEQKFTLSKQQLASINDKLNNFSTYKNTYDNPKIMDLPSTYILHDGKQIKVRLWNDEVPEQLMNLHEYVESILLEKKFFE